MGGPHPLFPQIPTGACRPRLARPVAIAPRAGRACEDAAQRADEKVPIGRTHPFAVSRAGDAGHRHVLDPTGNLKVRGRRNYAVRADPHPQVGAGQQADRPPLVYLWPRTAC